VLTLAGSLRRYFAFESLGQIYGVTPPLSPGQTIALGAGFLVVSLGLAVWAAKCDAAAASTPVRRSTPAGERYRRPLREQHRGVVQR